MLVQMNLGSSFSFSVFNGMLLKLIRSSTNQYTIVCLLSYLMRIDEVRRQLHWSWTVFDLKTQYLCRRITQLSEWSGWKNIPLGGVKGMWISVTCKSTNKQKCKEYILLSFIHFMKFFSFFESLIVENL